MEVWELPERAEEERRRLSDPEWPPEGGGSWLYRCWPAEEFEANVLVLGVRRAA